LSKNYASNKCNEVLMDKWFFHYRITAR